jgi:nitrate reductase delta subunit
MIELTGLYRHFGFDLTGRELPDYLPVMVDFLGISLRPGSRDGIGLRRRFLERYVGPGLGPLREALAKYESPYGLLVSALAGCVEQDLERMGDAPAWEPPADRSGRVASLPVLDVTARSPSDGRVLVTHTEVRP